MEKKIIMAGSYLFWNGLCFRNTYLRNALSILVPFYIFSKNNFLNTIFNYSVASLFSFLSNEKYPLLYHEGYLSLLLAQFSSSVYNKYI